MPCGRSCAWSPCWSCNSSRVLQLAYSSFVGVLHDLVVDAAQLPLELCVHQGLEQLLVRSRAAGCGGATFHKLRDLRVERCTDTRLLGDAMYPVRVRRAGCLGVGQAGIHRGQCYVQLTEQRAGIRRTKRIEIGKGDSAVKRLTKEGEAHGEKEMW